MPLPTHPESGPKQPEPFQATLDGDTGDGGVRCLTGELGMSGLIAGSLARQLIGIRRLEAGNGPTLGQAMAHFGSGATMVTVLFFGLLALVPSPGLPVGLILGSAVALIVSRMLIRGGDVVLPSFIASRRLPRTLLDAVLRRTIPLLRRTEKRMRPRLVRFSTGTGATAAGLMIIAQGMILAFPVPFGNAFPGAAIVVLALGLLGRDGICVLVGHGLGVLAAVLLFAMIFGMSGAIGLAL